MVSPSFSIEDVRVLAERFAARHLDLYTEEIRAADHKLSRKEINDPLWGTISVTPIEIAVIDSPLIQRLRSIRQLGVVHWVYPGAVHTRFEHTLGVLHQVQHLAAAINLLGIQKGHPALIEPLEINLLRLCALFHDVGHAAFSHVSENALEGTVAVRPLSAEFSRIHKAEGKKLSEIFAYFVVKSPAMRTFLEVLLDRYGSAFALSGSRSDNVNQTVETISSAIIGKKISDKLPLLHELISGPFDADKLDYFVRDAKFAGIPSLLDISRLVQKITIKELDTEELPDDIARNVNKIGTKYCLFGIKWSGVAVLDELHLARVLLYAKIYRHPKVIAIEQMLRGAILAISQVVSPSQLTELLYTYDDESLLSMTRSTLAEALGLSSPSSEVAEWISCAVAALQDIRARRLSVKAFQIQSRYPADPLDGNENQKLGLTRLRETVEHPQYRENFRKLLLEEVETILRAEAARELPTAVSLQTAIAVHPAGQATGGSQIARAYLLPHGAKPIPFRDYMVNRTAWADSYMSDQPTGYVFAPHSLADAVYIAVEKLLRMQFGVIVPPSALEASKRSSETIQHLKKKLRRAGYYRGTPFDIRPVPDRLQKADVIAAADKFAEKLALFQEPQDHPVSHPSNGRDRVISWLRQFDNDDHIECALQLLNKFRMLQRVDTTNAIRAFVGKNPAFRGATVVPFGSARDSGAIQAYFSADLLGTDIGGCKNLNELASDKSSKPIIFIDDFIASGGQAQDILAAGFGVKSLRMELGEQRDMFDVQIQDVLRRTKLGFVFAAAWDTGLHDLKQAAQRHELDAEVFGYIGEKQIPFAFDGCLQGIDEATQSSFRQRCTEIGYALQVSSETNITPEQEKKFSERFLGYGNRAMLLASPFNVPTQTFLPIWHAGYVDGASWTPLMARRKKT